MTENINKKIDNEAVELNDKILEQVSGGEGMNSTSVRLRILFESPPDNSYVHGDCEIPTHEYLSRGWRIDTKLNVEGFGTVTVKKANSSADYEDIMIVYVNDPWSMLSRDNKIANVNKMA